MADQIKPALTADEWAKRTAVRGNYEIEAYDDGSGVGLENRDTGYVGVSPEALSAVIALANAALPDDHAAKITRAMVDGMLWAADTLAQHGWSTVAAEADRLRRDAAKLASLLRP